MISWEKSFYKKNSKSIYCCVIFFLHPCSCLSLPNNIFYRLLTEISDVLERVEIRQKELEQENENLKEELRRTTSLLASRDFELRSIREKISSDDDIFDSLIDHTYHM